MMKLLRNLKTNTSGASAAEYALIVAVLGGLVVAGATYFGNSMKDSMDTSGQLLEDTDNTATVAKTVG
ncbi:MAG: Flp family type IVb pilin [Polymorphobacter sp.]